MPWAEMNAGGYAAFVRNYDRSSNIIWTRQFGSRLDVFAQGVASDDEDNVYATGTVAGSLAGSRGALDGFVRKYTREGKVVWTRQFGTSANDDLLDTAVAKSGVFVVGNTDGALSRPVQGGRDAFIRKYNLDGTVAWTAQFGGSNIDSANAVAVDSQGNAYVVGTVDYDNVSIRKFTPSARVPWVKTIDYREGANSTGVDVSGSSLYVAIESLQSHVIKYDLDGKQVWIGSSWTATGRASAISLQVLAESSSGDHSRHFC